MIQIEVDKDFCKGCELCITVCPRDVLALSKERGKAGFLVPEATKPEACTKCLMCELICPDFAIVVNGSPGALVTSAQGPEAMGRGMGDAEPIPSTPDPTPKSRLGGR